MESTPTGDLSIDEFREHGHAIVEWIARYLCDVERYPVLSRVEPGDVRRMLPASPPATGEPIADMLADFESALLPGMTHWNHPSFHAYFPTSASIPGILGEILAAGLNVNGMLWRTSPSVTELEQVTLDWLRQLMGLGDGWFGMITDTASISTLYAFAAAREKHPGLAVRERGLAGRADLPRMRIYASEQAHSSVDKAVITLGMGAENVVHIGVDDAFRMRADLLADAVQADRARGWLPLAAVATVGTTGTTSIDPVGPIAALCQSERVWLHVDAAYAGVAAMVPEYAWILRDAATADSVVVNPHKWLFTPFDLSAFYCRRMDLVRSAFSLVPEYLKTDQDTGVRNLMDTGIQLGRRFRALKLWMVLRHFGADGIRARLAEHMRLARLFAGWVDGSGQFELTAPVPFSVVCFRARDTDEFNELLLNRLNATGEVFLSHTKLDGRFTLRLAVGNLRTSRDTIEAPWRLVQEAANW